MSRLPVPLTSCPQPICPPPWRSALARPRLSARLAGAALPVLRSGVPAPHLRRAAAGGGAPEGEAHRPSRRGAYIALQAARQRQKTPEFISTYALRAGVEATVSQAVRAFGLRRSRYFGHAKTHLQCPS